MRVRHLILVIVMAGLMFGGTFTCKSNDDDDDDHFHISSTAASSGSGSSLSGG